MALRTRLGPKFSTSGSSIKELNMHQSDKAAPIDAIADLIDVKLSK